MSGKSFRFSLEPVLRLRKHETDVARRRLERAVAARREAEKIVAEAEDILNERVSRQHPHGPIGTMAMRRMATFREDARQKLDLARQRLVELLRAEEEARRMLVERQRDEETLEQLRDEEQNAFSKDALAAEYAFTDEQALSGYLRKNGHSSQ